jgi:tetratricopeptide (TPR) repeat protein
MRGLFQDLLKAEVNPGRLVQVFAVRDEASMKELMPELAGAVKGRSMPAGVFGHGVDKHLILLRLDVTMQNPYHVIYHEYVHLLSRLQFRRLPLWLSEGLAEFYATADIDDREVRWGQILPWHLQVLREAALLPLDELTGAGHDSPLYNEAHRIGIFYAQSAVFTHYLLMGDPKRRGQLPEFARLLEQDVPEADAMRQAFGDFKTLDKDLQAYVRQFRFLGLKAPAAVSPVTVQSTGALPPAHAAALRADLLVRRGQFRTGRRLAEEALRLAPDLGLAHEALGIAAEAEGRRKDALVHLSEAAALAPNSYVAHYRLGGLEIPDAADDRARREQALRTAIKVNPRFAPAYARLSQLLTGEGQAEESLALAKRAAALDPGRASHRLAVSQAYRRGGRPADADREETSVRAAARTDARMLGELVNDLQDGRPAEAEALLKDAVAANPRNRTANTLLGGLLSDQKRWDEAESLLREALRLEPESPLALNDLAYLLAQAERKPAEALKLIERGLKKMPGPQMLDTKGLVLVRLGRLDEAEQILREALADLPHAEILEHLGDVLQARGKTEEARDTWEQALESMGVTPRVWKSLQEKLGRKTPLTGR